MGHLTPEEAKTHYIEKMGRALGEQYSALWQEVAWLYIKWGDYVELFGTKPSRVDLLNQAAPAFFRIIQDSLWEDILLHLCRLTDPSRSMGKSNLTICNLTALATAPQAQASLPALIDDAINKTGFCRDWRNRHIAHRDLNLVLDASASSLEPASRQHVRDALAAIVAVLNAVESICMDSKTHFDSTHGQLGGALSLLYVIDDGVRAASERKDRLAQGDWREGDFAKRDI
jgi:hypothetical protein